MIDLNYYSEVSNKSLSEIQKLWKEAIAISVEDKGKYDEPYAEGVLKSMLKINESKILSLQTKFLENKDRSIKDLIEESLKEDAEVGAQPSTDFNVNPGGGGIIPPSEKKDKEFDKNLEENAQYWKVLDNDSKSRKTVVIADNKNEALDKGSSILKTHNIQVFPIGVKEFEFEGKHYKNLEEDWKNKKLSIYKRKDGKYGFIGPIFTGDDELNQGYKDYQDALNAMNKKGYSLNEKLSIGDKVSYGGEPYEILDFESNGTEKAKIKNLNTGEEKFVVKRAFESVQESGTDPSLKAPSEWWDEKIKDIKGDNPTAILGKIWADLSDSKKSEIRARYGKHYGPANEAVDREVVADSDVPYYKDGLEPVDVNNPEDFEKPLAESFNFKVGDVVGINLEKYKKIIKSLHINYDDTVDFLLKRGNNKVRISSINQNDDYVHIEYIEDINHPEYHQFGIATVPIDALIKPT